MDARKPLVTPVFNLHPLSALVIILTVAVFSLSSDCFGYTLYDSENLNLSLGSYIRNDLVTFKNVVSLDSKNKDDSTVYLGIDYSIGLESEFKPGGQKFYLKLERNGLFDYDAPLFIHNTLMTSGGHIDPYRNEELLPEVEEFWLDTPIYDGYRFKIGLYAYAVGNGFSLNGGYENFGCALFKESENFSWSLYYCRPDFNHKNRLGPKIHQDIEQGIFYQPNAANFFAADVKFKKGENVLEPYIGVLADYTSAGKRDNIFTAQVERDILGTLGLAYTARLASISWSVELAHNFGKGKTSDPEYKDITHTGYLIYSGLEYTGKKFKPSIQILVASGNKVTPEMAEDETLTSGKNRAFSYYSPLNIHLEDSISSINSDMLPIVAMGGGYGLNYGVPRPKTFASGDFDNLIMPCLGIDFNPTDKFSIGVYQYYLRSFEKGVATLDGEGKYLPNELGYETDLFIDYQLNKHTLISVLAGYFIPGKCYKERRDAEGSLLSPFVRGDGEPDNAYQIELAVELKF